MNDFCHRVTEEATKKHGATTLLTVTALQLCISCHWLSYVTCLSFILFRVSPFLSTSFINGIAIIDLFKETSDTSLP